MVTSSSSEIETRTPTEVLQGYLDALVTGNIDTGSPCPTEVASRMPTLGIKLSPQNCTIEDLRAVWGIADELASTTSGPSTTSNPIFSDVAGDVFEGMTLLAAMAEATSRVRIGLMVAGNTYRHPGVLAKMATTIDHLSGGRLEFGLGAAGAEVEHTMLGIPFYAVQPTCNGEPATARGRGRCRPPSRPRAA